MWLFIKKHTLAAKINYFDRKKALILLTEPNQKTAQQSTRGLYKGAKKPMRWRD